MHAQYWTFWTASLWAMLACAAAGAPPAASQLEALIRAEAQIKPLLSMEPNTGRYQWGPAASQPADAAAWSNRNTAVQVKLAVENGAVVCRVPVNGFMIIGRSLPEKLVGSPAYRVDLWLRVKVPRPESAAFGVMVGPANSSNINFNVSGGGAFAQAQAFGLNAMAAQNRPITEKDVVHMRIDVLSDQVIMRRNGCAPILLSGLLNSMVRTGDEQVAIVGSFQELHILGFSVSKAVAAPRWADPDWSKTGFSDQAALTKMLIRDVVPLLGDRKYPVRVQAATLIESIWPLSKPAVQQALAAQPDPETAVALSRMANTPTVMKVDGAQPGEEKEFPPIDDESPRATPTLQYGQMLQGAIECH